MLRSCLNRQTQLQKHFSLLALCSDIDIRSVDWCQTADLLQPKKNGQLIFQWLAAVSFNKVRTDCISLWPKLGATSENVMRMNVYN